MKTITFGKGLEEIIEDINLMLGRLRSPKGYVEEELTIAKTHLENLLYHIKEASPQSPVEEYCSQCKGPCRRLLK